MTLRSRFPTLRQWSMFPLWPMMLQTLQKNTACTVFLFYLFQKATTVVTQDCATSLNCNPSWRPSIRWFPFVLFVYLANFHKLTEPSNLSLPLTPVCKGSNEQCNTNVPWVSHEDSLEMLQIIWTNRGWVLKLGRKVQCHTIPKFPQCSSHYGHESITVSLVSQTKSKSEISHYRLILFHGNDDSVMSPSVPI